MRLLNLASATGISEAIDAGTAEPDDAFLHEIKTNNEVFAAFRTHRMQNDIAQRMVDDKGELKSFSQFARDVRPYTDHQNRQWLRTEYNTAVTRAHQAADWRQFEAEKDVLPNLEWIPSSSVHPGADHRVFWGTVLPIDHPFWKEHRPGDRWNCKCSLRNTDKEPTTVPKGTSNDEPNSGLENNPGKDGKLFSDKHPYMAENCGTCPFGNGKLWALAAGKKKNCTACKMLAKAEISVKDIEQVRKKTEAVKKARRTALQSITSNTLKNELVALDNIHSGFVYNDRKSLKTLLKHSFTEDDINAAMSIPYHLNELKFIRTSYLGEGKDMKDQEVKKNIANKIKRGVIQYNIYSYSYNGKRWLVKMEVRFDGKEYLYSFTKKP